MTPVRSGASFLLVLLLIAATPGIAMDAQASSPVGRRVVDIEGEVHAIGGRTASRGVALVFLATECPIANKLLPELNRIEATARELNVEFYGVASAPDLRPADLLAHRSEYGIEFPILLDASGDLASELDPTHTPEAFVLDRSGRLVYRGRINDAYVALTKRRTKVTAHDLRDAIERVSAGKPVENERTEPIGCLFEAWDVREESPGEVTYNRDVAPLLNANCVECHRAGAIGPFSLTTYEEVRRRARLIEQVTSDRTMPPWSPAPGHGDFLDSRRMTDREVERIAAWVRAGAPEGRPEDRSVTARFTSGFRLGEPDLLLDVEEFELPADGDDVFRCFVLPTGLTEGKNVIGVEFQAGNPTIVHHSIVYLDSRGLARRLDAQQEGPGYSKFGGPGFPPSGSLGGWAPGAQPVTFPEGMGRRLEKGEDVVLQIHYHPSGKKEKDRSRLALYFSDEPLEHVVRGTFMGRRDINIPPGVERYETRNSLVLPTDATLIRVTPHMHLLGKEMKVTATLPDGRVEPIIWIPDWDFNWQGQYRYREPLELPKGTRLDLYARYDNSAGNPYNPAVPPERVLYGEQTNDEMCYCFFNFITGSSRDTRTLRRAAWNAFARPNR